MLCASLLAGASCSGETSTEDGTKTSSAEAALRLDGAADQPPALLSELVINPPGEDKNNEYVEILCTPSAPLQSLYFVALEGDLRATDAGNETGRARSVVALGGKSCGSDGVLVVADAEGEASGAEAGTDAGTGDGRTWPAGITRVDPPTHGAGGWLENGTGSFLLVASPTPLAASFDYDTDEDGVLELPAGAVLVDAIAVRDEGASDVTYGGAVVPRPGRNLDAITRRCDDAAALSASAWFGGSLRGSGGAATYDPARLTAGAPAGATLSPGAPTACPVAGGGTGAEDGGGASEGGVGGSEDGTAGPLDAGTSEDGAATDAGAGASDAGTGASDAGPGTSDAGPPNDGGTATAWLSEVSVNPPGVDSPWELVELGCAPGARLDGLSVVVVEGDDRALDAGGNQVGFVDLVVGLDGVACGANGIVLLAGEGGHQSPAAATTVVVPAFKSASGGLENGTSTFLLVSGPTGAFVRGNDYDVDDDGVLELPDGVRVTDSIGVLDTGRNHKVYGPKVEARGDVDAFTRLCADATDASRVWVGGKLAGPQASSLGYAPAPGVPSGLALTPGEPNPCVPGGGAPGDGGVRDGGVRDGGGTGGSGGGTTGGVTGAPGRPIPDASATPEAEQPDDTTDGERPASAEAGVDAAPRPNDDCSCRAAGATTSSAAPLAALFALALTARRRRR